MGAHSASDLRPHTPILPYSHTSLLPSMLLPYASDRPPKSPPLAVVFLVLLHFMVFGLVWFVLTVRGAAAPVIWYANLSIVPAMPHWYSFITYALLHDSALHVSLNMLFLWVFGGSVEDAI